MRIDGMRFEQKQKSSTTEDHKTKNSYQLKEAD